MSDKSRREFLVGIASAVALPPLAAASEQTQQTRRLGVLVGLAPSEDAPIAQAFIRPFRESMRWAGWTEGSKIQIEYRFGGPLADLSRTKASAAELVALNPDVIYTQGLPATLAVRELTATIPIVFTQLIDPVGFGLAESLGHPGGNVTGFVVWDFAIAGKWIQLLHELVPDLAAIGLLFNPDTTPYASGLISAAKQADRGSRSWSARRMAIPKPRPF